MKLNQIFRRNQKNPDNELSTLRRKIDLVDGQLLSLLGERVNLVKQVGKYKNAQGLPSLDETRWQQVLRSRTEQGRNFGLSDSLVEGIFTKIHDDALRIEDEIGRAKE